MHGSVAGPPLKRGAVGVPRRPSCYSGILKPTSRRGYDFHMSSMQPRFPAHLRVAVSEEGGPSYETTTVSAAGMCVRLDRDLTGGALLSVAINAPNDERATPV